MPGIESRSARRFVVQIERLAAHLDLKSLLSEQGPKGLIQYERDIASLQRDIQREIGRLKVDRKSIKAARSQIDELAWVLRQSRSLGDALAWTLLARDLRVITPLTENKRVAVPSNEDDGARGVFQVAEHLMLAGWGIPVIHDITDSLRIGDITFVDAVRNRSRREFVHRTVEVKTHRISSTPNGDGSEMVEYRVTVVGHDAAPEEFQRAVIAQEMDLSASRGSARFVREDRRLEKQLHRMSVAHHKREAAEKSLSTLDGLPFLTLKADTVSGTDWKAIRQAIRRAHMTGIGTLPGTSLVSWLFIYNARGIGPEDLQVPEITQVFKDFMSKAPRGKKSSLTLMAVPPYQDDQEAPRSLPLMLWNIPKRAKSEILRFRLSIIALINTAGLERALEERGFEILPSVGSDPRSFQIATDLVWPDGSRAHLVRPVPWEDIADAVQDFTGLDTVIAKAGALRDLTGIPFQDLISSKSQGEL